jgi:hypothetical protein
VGAFFTNVQVQVLAGGELKAQKQVLKALRALAKRAGLEALDADHAHEADRSVVVVSGPRWISVYDQDTEDGCHTAVRPTSGSESKLKGLSSVQATIDGRECSVVS